MNSDNNSNQSKVVKLLSEKFDAKQNYPAIKQHAEELQNPKPQPGKEILNNGPSAVPKFEQ